MKGWMDEGWTGWMDERTDGRTDRWRDGWMDEGWMNMSISLPAEVGPKTGGVAVNRSATVARPTFPTRLGALAAGGGGRATAAASLAA